MKDKDYQLNFSEICFYYRVCHGFRLTKRDFRVNFDLFNRVSLSGAAGAVV